jgi:glycosyltransferase involved in cell wall biosynthesis
MKILQIISTPPFVWATGGCTRVTYEISRELIKRGHNVTIVTTDMYKPNKRYKIKKNPEFINGLEIYRFRNISNKLAWKYYLYSDIGITMFLRKHICKYDVVHLQDFRSFQTIATTYYCKKFNVPYVLQPHGGPLDKNTLNMKLIFDKIFTDKTLKYSSYVIAVTKYEKTMLKSYGVDEDKIKIVPNGIDLSQYENLPERGEFRKKYSIRDDEKIILYLGRLHKIKGIDLLVKAFSDLVKELDKIKLMIVGPDDGFLPILKKHIENLKIGDKVLFTGPLYERDKLEAYVDADVYVLPSVYEIFGITVLEACACGAPVIVTDRCGIADVVDSKVGYVVEYDKDRLRDAIFKILSDEELRRRFGEEGRRLAIEEFGWDPIVRKIEGIYETTLAKRKRKIV